jgi:hypothetical protein
LTGERQVTSELTGELAGEFAGELIEMRFIVIRVHNSPGKCQLQKSAKITHDRTQ